MVCASILETTGIELNPATLHRYAQNQHIGTGALNVGNPGRIATFTFEVIKEAIVAYINLVQFEGKTLATAKYLPSRVNKVVNSKPGKQERKDYGLLDRIKRESTLQLTVGKQKNQEERHIRWTNLDQS
jgi:hypothetical protein